MGRTLAADFDGGTLGRYAGALDRPPDAAGNPTQVLAGEVCRQAH